MSSVLGQDQVETLTFTAPTGQLISSIEVGGSAFHLSDGQCGNGALGSTVGLDNLRYETNPLKTEVVVGDALVFGNFYAGAIHGVKTQEGTGLPAPNIELQLLDASGSVAILADGSAGVTTTDADGNYWFCLLYTSPSPRDATLSRMPSSA